MRKKMKKATIVLFVVLLTAAGSVMADSENISINSPFKLDQGKLLLTFAGDQDELGIHYKSQDENTLFRYIADSESRQHYLGFVLAGSSSFAGNTLDSIKVFCDGIELPQSSISVENGYYENDGLRVAMLFDQSYAMENELLKFQIFANTIIGALSPADHLLLAGSTDEASPTIFNSWETVGAKDLLGFKKVVGKYVAVNKFGTMPSGSTRTLDAIASIIESYPAPDEGHSPVARNILLVFSDMNDDSSKIPASKLAQLAQANNVKIVVVSPEVRTLNRSTAAEVSSNNIWKMYAQGFDPYASIKQLAAPQIGVIIKIDQSFVPGDGLVHCCNVLINDDQVGQIQLDLDFKTFIFKAKFLWIKILLIVVPVLFLLVLLAAIMIISSQNRRRKYALALDESELDIEMLEKTSEQPVDDFDLSDATDKSDQPELAQETDA